MITYYFITRSRQRQQCASSAAFAERQLPAVLLPAGGGGGGGAGSPQRSAADAHGAAVAQQHRMPLRQPAGLARHAVDAAGIPAHRCLRGQRSRTIGALPRTVLSSVDPAAAQAAAGPARSSRRRG